VLQWIIARANGSVQGHETVFGTVPHYDDISWQGLAYDKSTFEQLMGIDVDNSRREFEDQLKLFAEFGAKLPPEMEAQRQAMLAEVRS